MTGWILAIFFWACGAVAASLAMRASKPSDVEGLDVVDWVFAALWPSVLFLELMDRGEK